MNTNDKLYTKAQFAKLMGVCQATIRRWEKKGIIKAVRIGSRYIRYTSASVDKLLQSAEKG